jgi:hypothetical protein
MTLPFWTKEKKQDYLDLYKQREQQRKYNREYMQKARNEGKYKILQRWCEDKIQKSSN